MCMRHIKLITIKYMCVKCIIKLLTFFYFEIALVPEKETATTVEYIYYNVNKTFKYLYSCIHEQ